MNDTAPEGLDLHSDPEIARFLIYTQYAGWALLVVIVSAALLGFAGSGPLASAEARADGIRVRYSRFARMTSATALEIMLERGRELRISRHYLSNFDVPQFLPEPQTATLSGDSLTLQFGGPAEAPIEIRVEMSITEGTFGIVEAQVGTPNSTASFRQFIWP